MRGRGTLQETSASMGPTRLAEPPPARGDVGDRDAARWVAAGIVGFGGFASEADAARAAWIAHCTLARRDAGSAGARECTALATPTLAGHDGRDVVLADGREIARLVGPRHERGPHGEPRATYGFELRLPPPADELHARAASYLIDRELRFAGLVSAARLGTGGPTSSVDRGPPPPRPLRRAS